MQNRTNDEKYNATVEKKSVSKQAKLIASGATGIVETLIFHPLDTIARRLIKNTDRLPFSAVMTDFKNQKNALFQVVFKEASDQGWKARYTSLLPGIRFGVVHKMMERTHSFGLQPVLSGKIKEHYGSSHGVFIEGFAGAILGGSQFVYLPLDSIKTQCQLASLKSNSKITFAKAVNESGMKLYAGSLTYITRTSISAFTLFSASAMVKQKVFKLKNPSDATTSQTFAASTIGALAAVTVTNPLNVIKTRIQAEKGAKSGWTIFKNTLMKEGPTAFGKGIIPLQVTIAPRLIFTMTVSDIVAKEVDKMLVKIKSR